MQSEDNSSTVCVSCKHTFSGNYCNNCGEKKLDPKERTFKYFLGQLINAITFSDTKMLRSIWLLISKPGFLAKEYVTGRRNLYTKPLPLFLIINLIYFLLQPVDTFYTGLVSQAKYQSYSSMTAPIIREKMKSENLSAEQLVEKYDKAALDYSKTLIILMVFLFTIPLGLLFYRKKQLFFNHIIFSLGYISFLLLGPLLLMSSIIFGLDKLLASFGIENFEFDINGIFASTLLITIITFYLVFGLRRFYEEKYWLVIPKALILAFSTIAIVIAYRFLMFFIIISLI